MDWSTKRIVPRFTFEEPERLHRERIAAEFPEVLFHLGSLLQTINDAFRLIQPLPPFEKRDRSTLLAALTTRSFKSLSCAADLAVRGYYVQAFTLVRAVHENRWICWAVDRDPAAAEAVWNQHWPPRFKSFRSIAADIDADLTARGLSGAEVDLYDSLYGDLSEITHPRGKGVRMEFDASGQQLETAPSWDSDYAYAVLGYALSAAQQVRVLLFMLPLDPSSLDAWKMTSDAVSDAAHRYIQREIARFKASNT
jgi:hypothetical protein